MRTTMKPSTMNPMYPHNPTGFAPVRGPVSPPSLMERYSRWFPQQQRSVRGNFVWHPSPSLF